MASQRPPGRGSFPSRGPRPTSGHAGARRPRPATGGRPADRPASPQARREAKPSRARVAQPKGQRPAGSSVGEDRLQKILAHAGVGSRRACEELILAGRVTVGGQVVKELGTKVDLAKASVAVDGQKIQAERLVYFAVNKPKGYVSTNNDPSGRPRVLDLLPNIAQRVYTIGRLDEMSVGLMLVTNDGELANKLAHPKFGVEKLYRVIVAGTPERDTLNQLTEGIWLAEGKVRAKRVRAVAKKGEATILEMVLAEGKNREVRRMLAKLGHKVMMLTRVAVGPITLKGLAAGQVRPLTGREVDLLRRVAAGEPVPMPWAAHDKRSRPEGDRPRRPFGAPPAGAGRGPGRDEGPAPGRPASPHADRRDKDRPRGPGYRPDSPTGDRRDGPPRGAERRPGGPPPRFPGMFQANPGDAYNRFDDRGPGPNNGPRGDRRADGPRPPQGQGGPRPYGRPEGPRPPYRPDGPRPQGRQDGPRPYGRQDGPQGGPRGNEGRGSDGPPRPYGRQDGPRHQGSGNPGGPPRPYGRQDGPRGDGGRGGDGPPRPYGRQDGPQARPPFRNDAGPRPPRPGQRPGDDRPGQAGGPRDAGPGQRRFSGEDRRPTPQGGGNGDRRPRPAQRPPGPGSPEPRRKVIGLGGGQATPPPPPQAAERDDRPKSRLKRPAPRGGSPGAGRPMPKRRPGGRDAD